MEDVLEDTAALVWMCWQPRMGPHFIYMTSMRSKNSMEDYRRYFHSDVLHCEVLYASKAFCIQEMMRLAQAA